MQIEINRSTVYLARDGLIALRDAKGTQICCQSGSLWVTQEGEIKDAVLAPGEALTIANAGLTLITALHSSALALTGRKSARSAKVPVRTLLDTKRGSATAPC